MSKRTTGSGDSTQPTPTPERGQKKGRPTPTRREAQARHQRPLVPADRKAAKRAAREKRNEAYRREQEALLTGDERYLPPTHRGKVRRFVRDWLDARWSASEFIVPVMLLFLVGITAVAFANLGEDLSRTIALTLSITFYSLFALSIVEGIIVWRGLRRRIEQRYPDEDIPRGTWFYAYSRMVMARRWRTPAPQVKRGEFPATSPRR
ncbi:DUF3043 domain-containing protein [Schaalia canis]|uniref:DUF3043 domain-containing protein n=1 Tax=Schaalia canis TaxID=100469 RepID=A0A3P1SHS5_9ACTO|nr:DUF3043 domain-containing protein [Schaalia canis]RRC96325.1 DUF3043 domain-containing protein [Schaalia canis]